MYTVPMSLIDFIPVLLFGVAAFLLQKDLYPKMSRNSYTLFCAGSADVFIAGFLKALYKLLYALGVCDFTALSSLFFPLQSIGFMMAGIGLFRFAVLPKRGKKLYAAAPAVFSGTFLFVGLMIFGLLGMDFGLCRISAKLKKPLAIVFFALSFVLCLMMGYLSSRDFTKEYMNWMAEGVNILGQGCLLIGTVIIHRGGPESLDFDKK